jgi:hypothetical protein
LAVIAAAIAFGIVYGSRTEARAAAQAKLEEDLPPWFRQNGYEALFAEEGRPDLEPTQRLEPPVLPILVRSSEHFIYYGSDFVERTKLPIAESLSNVGTVAVSLETISLYTLGALPYKSTVVFVDARTRTVVARRSFATESPPPRITIDALSQRHDAFWMPIISWIATLPLRD